MSTSEFYEREGEWGGYTVTRSKVGWCVEGWSRVQGNLTNYKYLVKPFNGMMHDAELDADWNQCYKNGEVIAEMAFERPSKILRKGWIVE